MKKIEIYIKILDIYRRLWKGYKTGTLGESEIINLYVEYLKEYIKLGTNNPTFEGDLNTYEGCNCYCYAIGMNCPKIFSHIYEDVMIDDLIHTSGFLTLKCYTNVKQEIIENFYDGFNVLGIKTYESDVDIPNTHGGYKIAIYFNHPESKCGDFHMARENVDKSWSEKIGYNNEIRQFATPFDTYYKVEGYELDRVLEIVKPTIRTRIKG